MGKMLRFSLLLGTLSTLFAAPIEQPKFPYPQHVAYKEALDLSAYSQGHLEKQVASYYAQWKKDFLVKEGKLYRIASDKEDKSRTVSEGQGYGMMIVALMAGYDKDAKKIFDGLYAFAKMHPSEICSDFMTWQVPEIKGESDSAFDGDADIAYALLLAEAQWGDSVYKEGAKRLILALMEKVIGKDSHLPLLGDWVEQEGKKYNQYTTRSSDFMLSHFRAFYRFSQDKRWLAVIKATQDALLGVQNDPKNHTALVSDFIYHDNKGYHPTSRKFLEEEDDSYYYNACRVPFRVGLDALLNSDKTSVKIAQKMAQWIEKRSEQNPQKIFPGYRLSGEAIAKDYTSAVFVAPFAVSLKLLPTSQHFFDAIYEAIKQRHENYFEDSINLLSQLIMIGAFWDPTQVKARD